MEVQFDNDKRGNNAAPTRIYAPTKKSYMAVELEQEGAPIVAPQPNTADDPQTNEVRQLKEPWPTSSILLLILAIFTMAGTALFGLKGAADITSVYGEIADIQTEIDDLEDQISQVINLQGDLNDYTSINQANIDAGRTMNWPEGGNGGTGALAGSQPSSPQPQQSPEPQSSAESNNTPTP